MVVGLGFAFDPNHCRFSRWRGSLLNHYNATIATEELPNTLVSDAYCTILFASLFDCVVGLARMVVGCYGLYGASASGEESHKNQVATRVSHRRSELPNTFGSDA